MRAHDGRTVRDGFLDYAMVPDSVRVTVRAMVNIYRIDDQFFAPKASLALLLAYWKEVGVRSLLQKIRSRRSERVRNSRFVSVGVGTVLEGADEATIAPGTQVLFFAPSHPRWIERLVLPSAFCAALPADTPPFPATQAVPDSVHEPPGRVWMEWTGWQHESGVPPGDAIARWLTDLVPWLRERIGVPGKTSSSHDVEVHGAETPVRGSRAGTASVPSGRKTLAVVGYGNYVKGVALPELRRRLALTDVYDLDPMVLPTGSTPWALHCGDGPDMATAPVDAVLIAGYHHTHAPLAAEVLRAGRWAIIEKPIATTEAQLGALESAITEASGRFAVCFQRRYDRFTEFATEDLGGARGEPISYACVVFEVPLPTWHWYRWPASGTRLLSNGCHWIDQFLWLNHGVDVRSLHVRRARSGDVHTWIELENDATFSMLLTDQGSARIGLQDYVDLRAGSRTIRIRNSTTYLAESEQRVIRKASQLRVDPYGRMYRAIASRIIADGPGDDIGHMVRSARCVLRAESMLHEQHVTESF